MRREIFFVIDYGEMPVVSTKVHVGVLLILVLRCMERQMELGVTERKSFASLKFSAAVDIGNCELAA